MEAATLKTKKQIHKGKLKKSMRNVLYRPDPTFWPQTSEDEGKLLTEELKSLKVDIPDYKKPLWSEIKNIPKESRPKPPPIPKVEGLIFGIAQCQEAIEKKECVGVLIESAVNPKSIVQPLIDMCTEYSIPVLCLKELRRLTKVNFGIHTSVLGVKQNFLPELQKNIYEISKIRKPPKNQTRVKIAEDISLSANAKEEKMDVEHESVCPYLYRSDKSARIFTPPLVEHKGNISNKFAGQNFIKLSNETDKEIMSSTEYMKAIVKKITSNPNRKKITRLTSKTSKGTPNVSKVNPKIPK